MNITKEGMEQSEILDRALCWRIIYKMCGLDIVRAQKWYATRHTGLGGFTPDQLLELNRVDKLKAFITEDLGLEDSPMAI